VTGRVFAYGTLELPEVVEALLGRALPGVDALLSGYVRSLLRGQCYPGIVARAGARTRGVLYFEVEEWMLALLDRYEGSLYRRLPVRVTTAAGGTLAAQAWILPPARRALLSGEPWDRERFAARHLREWTAHCERLRRAPG
jgi:gamma-glutamylcyclotransferase (GGCT)/AIG2-like uncharacterized protein YtfP